MLKEYDECDKISVSKFTLESFKSMVWKIK